MNGKFTTSEVLAVLEKLRPGEEVVNRFSRTDADSLVASIKDLVFGSINADIDSVYAILLTFIRTQSLAGNLILALLADIKRLAVIAQQAPAIPSTDKYDELVAILAQLEEASGKKIQADLITKFKNVSALLAGSSKTSAGLPYTGLSPETAQVSAIAKAKQVDELVAALGSNLAYIREAITSYMASDVGDAYFKRQVSHLALEMQAIKEADTSDMSETILAASVASTLLSEKSVKRDITEPKWDGEVDTLPGSNAMLLGDTRPFILSAAETATLKVNGQHTGDIVGPTSLNPHVEHSFPPGVFERQEQGTLSPLGGTEMTSDGLAFTPLALVQQIPYLRGCIKPKSVQVNVVYHDATSNLSHTVTLKDDGYGNLCKLSGWLAVNGVVAPAEAVPSPNGVYTFQFAAVGNSETGFDFSVLDANATPVLSLKTLPHPELTDIVDVVESSNTSIVWGSVNYSTGVCSLDLSNGPGTEATFHLGRYGYETGGLVNYDTGYLSVHQWTTTGATSVTYQFLSPTTVSYSYYPLGKLQHYVDGSPVTLFNTFNIMCGNDSLETYTLGVPPAWVPSTNAATANVPIRSASELFTLLNASTEAGSGSVLTNKYTTALTAGGGIRFSTSATATTGSNPGPYPVVGSSSRIATPMASPASLSGLEQPFSPTWVQSNPVPDSLNKVLGLLNGEGFGADTSLGSVTAPDAAFADEINISATSFPVTHGSSEAGSFQNGGTSFLLDKAADIEPGDDVLIVAPHFAGHVKVATAEKGASTTAITLRQPAPLPVTGYDTVGPMPVVPIVITRNRLRIFSNSTDSTSALEVLTSGFGLTGTATNLSNEVALKVTIDKVYPKDGYIIRKGDPVYQANTKIGTVAHVDGVVVTLYLDPLLVPNVDFVYPFSSIKIVALGWHSFVKIQVPLQKSASALALAAKEPIALKTATYAVSGTGYAQFMLGVNALVSEVTALTQLYANYASHVVSAVNTLLSSLKEEKLSLVYGLLSSMRFSDVAELTAESLSEQKAVEVLLEDLLREYAGNSEYMEYLPGVEILDDYENRGFNEQAELSPIVTVGEDE